MEVMERWTQSDKEIGNMNMNRADRISKLPAHITELILTYLPLRDAVRTSILSKEWRHKWTTIPSLVFSPEDCCPTSCNDDKALIRTKLAAIFNHVLSHHSGSIQVFKAKKIHLTPRIESWIPRVSTRSINELVLANDTEEPFDYSIENKFELPFSLYACDRLAHLSLSRCKMPDFKGGIGFMGLKTLDLLRVAFSNNNALESLISGFPMLENLSLLFLHGVNSHSLRLNAPNLKNLRIFHSFEDIITHDKLDHEKKGWCCSLGKLRKAYVMNVCCDREEDLEFIKWVLMNSPALEKMYIYGYSHNADPYSVYQEIPRFRKASTRAQIVFISLY